MLYKAFGEQRHSSGTTPTDYRYTGQLEQAGIGLYYYGARWYDPKLGRFTQADSIIPQPGNPLDWDRYAYSSNNPINYTDPTGHTPEWFDWLQGAVYQYANDMTLGAVDQAAYALGVCMDCNVSEAYRQGQQVGQGIAIAQASVDQAVGALVAGAGVAGIVSTAGGGLACAVASGGICVAPAAGVIAVEAGMVIAGTTGYIYGSGVVAFAKNNPASKPEKSGSWSAHSGQIKEINGQKIRVDWESSGQSGNVHVTIGNEKIYIHDPSDLSALPKSLQNNPWVKREVQRGFDQLWKLEGPTGSR